MAQKFHTRYSHPVSSGITFVEPSLTEQSFGYETDINNIVKKAVQSSLPPNTDKPIFGSKFDPTSYNEALNLVTEAKQQFDVLPSNVRNRFENNPVKLLEFLQDESNYDEAVKLGLVNKKPVFDVPIDSVNKNPVQGTPVASGEGVNQVSSD